MPRSHENLAARRTVVTPPSHVNTERQMAAFHARLRERGLKSTAQRDAIARVFFENRPPYQRRGTLRSSQEDQPARRLRHHLPHAPPAEGMRAGFRAPLRRGPGPLRDRQQAPSRPFHLRAMRQDNRVREPGYRAPSAGRRAPNRRDPHAAQDGTVRAVRRMPR